MVIDLSWYELLFRLTLFILLLIKLRNVAKKVVAPLLQQVQQDAHEKWYTLQEKHTVLIAKKKQLATQFLQQEKQIALLTTKLESWYKIWQEKQEAQKLAFRETERKIQERYEQQQICIAEKRRTQEMGQKILHEAVASLTQQAHTFSGEYVTHSIEHLSALQKDNTRD